MNSSLFCNALDCGDTLWIVLAWWGRSAVSCHQVAEHAFLQAKDVGVPEEVRHMILATFVVTEAATAPKLRDSPSIPLDP